ncbi:cysteine desulfurase family protein [Methylocystis heyeri]|uniref:Cysteine desulfurase n=1 Tax=Methylocystis heyeri TaxID=391905 RepID=A0A6B8KDN8_9HYPH|nr:cysteine desulfurase family protein [Methylocystis heyeri]QGM44543.1 aminotransferase class V-fold PLP-dependent enzyme [Methylocystis heyeri]
MPRASRAYLDYNATAPLRPQAREAMLSAFDALGNPSSTHAEGRAAREVLERARRVLAGGLGAAPRNLVFTSGATEAANLALTPNLQLGRNENPFDRLLVSGGEHAATLLGHRFPAGQVETLPLTAQGALDLEALEDALKRAAGQRIVLALQAVNNETGAIQPVREAADRVHAAGGVLVCDATQAVGRCAATFSTLNADVLFFSSHKLGGPFGAGALAFARDDIHIRDAVLKGGGQEGGRRSGTENVAAAAGFAAAFSASIENLDAEIARLGALRDAAEAKVAEILPSAQFLCREGTRAPNVCAFLAPGFVPQTMAMALDLEGVAVSSGSACSSGKVRPSHVLAAMGLKEDRLLRVSLGWSSKPEDVELFGIALARVAARMRPRRSAA